VPHSRLAAVLAAALLLPAIAAARPRPSPAPAAGSIEGHVTLSRMAAPRIATRYPGDGGGMTHRAGSVPQVAFIVGPVEGSGGGRGERPRLTQQDTSFHPAVLVIPVGTSVEFPNRDPFFHNVFSYSATKRFDLGRFPRGESRTVVFDRAGVVKVYCEIHQWMRSAVLVVQNPYHAEVGADGRFSISGVPAGSYRLAVWDFDRGQRVVQVTVPAAGAARVEVNL
jgi:plastocyanin